MTPRQALNTVVGYSASGSGVFGHTAAGSAVIDTSDSADGVSGYSNSFYGVAGTSISGGGVYGATTFGTGVLGTSSSGDGVIGQTGIISHAGVIAAGAGVAGIALRIQSGGIRVPGAGISATTPVFVHRATASNIEAGNTHRTTITHPLTDGDPNAILIITHNYNPSQTGNVFDTHPTGVFYNPSLSQWQIYHEDSVAIAPNVAWNVLVVKP